MVSPWDRRARSLWTVACSQSESEVTRRRPGNKIKTAGGMAHQYEAPDWTKAKRTARERPSCRSRADTLGLSQALSLARALRFCPVQRLIHLKIRWTSVKNKLQTIATASSSSAMIVYSEITFDLEGFCEIFHLTWECSGVKSARV